MIGHIKRQSVTHAIAQRRLMIDRYQMPAAKSSVHHNARSASEKNLKANQGNSLTVKRESRPNSF